LAVAWAAAASTAFDAGTTQTIAMARIELAWTQFFDLLASEQFRPKLTDCRGDHPWQSQGRAEGNGGG
jgi:hypothetical protein